MSDVLTPEQRRLNMSNVRSKNSKPEMLLRRGLHARGLRYQLHQRELPGCPDLVFRRYKAVIFVHGCFWHGHKCHLFKLPDTRREFWQSKICGNVNRDSNAIDLLCRDGWRVVIVWECALRGTRRLDLKLVLKKVESFLKGNRILIQVTGTELVARDTRI
jgi:DNA mismatch endonuclease (patch repair protein)